MAPSPHLARLFFSWLAAQTATHAEKTVVDEVKRRMATGDLGDYDGVLFKDAFRPQGQAEGRISVGGVDLGVVGATKSELVGILDKMGTPKVVKGDSYKYYIGAWKGRRIAVVQTGSGFESAKKGTEALLQAFRPTRVVSVGFAKTLVSSLSAGALFVPNRLIKEDGTSFDLSRPALRAPQEEKNEEAPLGSDEACLSGDPILSDDYVIESEDFSNEEPEPESPPKTPSLTSYEFLRRFATGALVSVDREVVKKVEKQRLAKELGASALDRETWAVAEACGEGRTPFLPLRVIYDARTQAGSKEAARAVSNSGQNVARTLGALFGAVSKRPGAALDVYRLKEQSLEAADKLAKALEKILAAAQ